MTIIEADGVETEPLTADSLNIFSGECQGTHNLALDLLNDFRSIIAQRYSIVVSALSAYMK